MRILDKLTAIKVKRLSKPGLHSDGGGLYLFIKPDGGKYWKFRYRSKTSRRTVKVNEQMREVGKLRDKGLGPVWDVSLTDARKMAADYREMLRKGVDPIDATNAERKAVKVQAATQWTFGACVDAHIAAHRAGWRNDKHAAQWRSTLDNYAEALLPLPVAEIDTDMVQACLEPHWATKTETMTRVRQRIEAVLDWAIAKTYRAGPNPARWRGHLAKLLAEPTKLKTVKHRAAVPYKEVGAFVTELRQKQGLAATAIELLILTAVRPNEIIEATWLEIDLDDAKWVIPRERMKSGHEHRIPLAPRAVELLRNIPKVGEFVFPGLRKGPMTTAAMLKTVKEMRPGMTVHGFRSTFRNWVADCTTYPADMAEFALAHALKDATVAAYLRADMFDKRAKMMAEWAQHCDSPATPADVAGGAE